MMHDSPAPRSDDAPLEQLLTYRMSILSKLLDRRTAATLNGNYGLNVAEWRVLAQLSVRSPSTVRWLADRMKVNRAEISRAASNLARRGLVRREEDPDDARSALFFATEAGVTLYQEIMPARQELHRDLMSTFTDEEGRLLLAAIDRLTERLSG